MALPEITVPAGTPAFLADDHAIELKPAYGDLPLGAGHSRKRRVCTSPPRVVRVAWRLISQAQVAEVDAWFENDLQVGTLEFAALVKHQGAGARWWRAQWVEPYAAVPLPGGHVWTITGALLLTGEPSVEAPVPTSMAAEIVVALNGSAVAGAGKLLEAEIVVALEEA